jgi:putative Mg2+ transporter-C (MgtC) family protein
VHTLAEFFARTTIDLPVTLFRLVLSFALGGLIGIEREWHRQSAGLRTHILISVGATLFTLLSLYIPQTFEHIQVSDPARIAAQVVSGIGFLGGGAIFRLGVNVRGLTTAASIWAAAGIGMAVGSGLYDAALIASGIVLFALFAMAPLERRYFPDRRLRAMEIMLRGPDPDVEKLYPILEGFGIGVRSSEMSRSFKERTTRLRLTVLVPDRMPWSGFYKEIGKVKGIGTVTVDQKL